MKNNNQKSGKSAIIISFITFFIIALLQSCQAAHLKKVPMEGQASGLNIPKISWEESFRLQKVEEYLNEKGLENPDFSKTR